MKHILKPMGNGDNRDNREDATMDKLPTELQLMICERVDDPRDLASLARSCRALNTASSEVLYNHIFVNTHDLAQLFRASKASGTPSFDIEFGNPTNTLRALLSTLKGMQKPSCKEIKLLDFAYDEFFFENAMELGFRDEIEKIPFDDKVPSSSKSVEGIHGIVAGVSLKAAIVAAVTKLENLAVDLPPCHGGEDFFSILRGQMKRRFVGEESDPFFEHCYHLKTLEIRSAVTIHSSQHTIEQGTLTISGSWPKSHFPALQTFKWHGNTLPQLVLDRFTGECVPNTIKISGFKCNGWHKDWFDVFQSLRLSFKNTLANFFWDNMNPCSSVMNIISRLLTTQSNSLKTLSLTRNHKVCEDIHRHQEDFRTGNMAFESLKNLEYLDVNSRFLVPDAAAPGITLAPVTLHWLGLPASLITLSIDAIVSSDVEVFKMYIKRLLAAINYGWLPKLKSVRCSFLGVKGGRKIQAWKVLENLPGQFLFNGVWLEAWEYDIGEEEEEDDTISARVISRRRR